MNNVMNSLEITTVCFALLAVAWDISTRRIPNVLTFGAALVALIAHAYSGGWNGLGMAAGGWAAGVALFFPVFALGGMGAGDVKLLGAVGAWLGPVAAVWVALYSGIAGGLMGLIVAGYSGYLAQAITNVKSLVMYWRIVGLKPAPELTLSTHHGPRLAYAVPVFAGLMVTIWLQ
jgi:prepilin peptidase CpaA